MRANTASSYKGLTTKELTTRLIAADKENAKLAFLLKTIEPELVTANETLHDVTFGRNSFKASLEEANKTIANLRTQLENATLSVERAVNQKETFYKEFDASRTRNSALIKDLDYEKKRRISAENKAFDLETRLHNTVASEYPASDIPSYMVGVRIDRNGEIA